MSRRIIHLDAGHGGHDPGAVANGRREKDITLEIARAAGHHLREFGADARLTRNSDVFIPVTERAQIANRAGADYLTSIHLNASPNAAGHGVEVWIRPNASRFVADTAAMMCNEISRRFGLRNRGVRHTTGFGILNTARIGAMLLEVCFIDHAGDMAIYDRNRAAIARCVAEVHATRFGLSRTSKATPNPPAASTAPNLSAPAATQTFVQWMQANGMDSSFANRARLARQHGIMNYTGTAEQNMRLWNLLRAGQGGSTPASARQFFPAPANRNLGLVDSLNAIRVDSGMAHRGRIARANGIAHYAGTAAQNTKLLNLLRQGRLARP